MVDSSNARAPRVRLKREERERLIVSQAIAFFSEVGLSGDTTALAASMGVAQPLIYRYFENKEALIARVFEETFLSNWNPLWEEMLTDPAKDLRQRLLTFHNDFSRVQLTRERVRLSLFFALSGWDMQPYFRLMRNRVYVPIATGLREHAGAPSIKSAPLREFEVDLAKSVVEKIQYYGIRKWVYGLPDLPPIEPLIEISVSALLDGAQVAVKSFQGKGRLYRHERK
jgi:AcrR family transcriptional regulator